MGRAISREKPRWRARLARLRSRVFSDGYDPGRTEGRDPGRTAGRVLGALGRVTGLRSGICGPVNDPESGLAGRVAGGRLGNRSATAPVSFHAPLSRVCHF